jgi:hypothetical protein
MTRKWFPVLVFAAIAVTGCTLEKPNPKAGGGGLAGNWVPETGGYTATFDNGLFQTVASDTGAVISRGNYIALSETEIELTWLSNVTGLNNTARCARPDLDTLRCSDQAGKGFVLRRINA